MEVREEPMQPSVDLDPSTSEDQQASEGSSSQASPCESDKATGQPRSRKVQKTLKKRRRSQRRSRRSGRKATRKTLKTFVRDEGLPSLEYCGLLLLEMGNDDPDEEEEILMSTRATASDCGLLILEMGNGDPDEEEEILVSTRVTVSDPGSSETQHIQDQ